MKPQRLIHLNERENASLTCKAFGNPTPTIEWSRPFFTLPKGRVLKQHGKLTIQQSQKVDSGIYVCKARNKLGTIQIVSTVIVTSSSEHRTSKSLKVLSKQNCIFLMTHFTPEMIGNLN